MPQLMRDLIQDVDNLRRDVSRIRTARINSIATRQEIQALVDEYFKNVRPAIAPLAGIDELIGAVDSQAQELLSLSHRRSITTKLKQALSKLKQALIDLEIKATCDTGVDDSPLSVLDARIIGTLEGLIPSAALSYRQALEDLTDTGRKSYRGPATDLREALRETLDHLAPDSEVRSQPGFRLEPETNRPTMKQKVRYILAHRGLARSQSETSEQATESVETATAMFVRSVYARSSASAHTPTDRDEVLRVRDWVRVVLCELLALRTE